MTGEIKIGVQKMEEALSELKAAKSEFEPYSQNFMEGAEEELTGFQSDFMDRMRDLLENMADTKAPQMLENLEEFVREAEGLKNVFRQADHVMSGQLKE